MKVKLKSQKGSGHIELVVDDEKINNKYDASKSNPVVIASMTEFFNSGCWSVLDLRISKARPPSPYLEAGSQHYKVESESDRQTITSELHTFRIEKNKLEEFIYWNTWDVYCWDGDNKDCQSKSGEVMNQVARFTYQGAKAKMQEIRQFWEKFEGNEIEKAKVDNPYRQKSDTYFFMKNVMAREAEVAKNKADNQKKASNGALALNDKKSLTVLEKVTKIKKEDKVKISKK